MIKHLRYDAEMGTGFSLGVSETKRRYVLAKSYHNDPFLMVIGLNPSIADLNENSLDILNEKTGYIELDHTTKRVDTYARSQNMSWMMVNLHPHISTKPTDFPTEDYYMLFENRRLIREYALRFKVQKIWCAWGEVIESLPNPGNALSLLGEALEGISTSIVARGFNRNGHPRHPSRIADEEPEQQFDLKAYSKRFI